MGIIKENWPADRVERWTLDRLIPYARNARTHSDAQVAQIAASMKEWGWTNPILVDEDGVIIAGHGRVQAARVLGWPEAPVMVAAGWTEAQKRAYTLADNKLALNAGWDDHLMAVELGELASLDGFNVELTGFTLEEIGALLDIGGGAFPDLPDSDRDPYQQRTFVLHDQQAIIVEAAIAVAKKQGAGSSDVNENTNGNAITAICSAWMAGNE